jgi:hypothetical protein
MDRDQLCSDADKLGTYCNDVGVFCEIRADRRGGTMAHLGVQHRDLIVPKDEPSLPLESMTPTVGFSHECSR